MTLRGALFAGKLKQLSIYPVVCQREKVLASLTSSHAIYQVTSRAFFSPTAATFSCQTLPSFTSSSHYISLEKLSHVYQQKRLYSKSKKKSTSKIEKPRAPLTDLEMLPIIDVTGVRTQVASIIDQLKHEFNTSLNVRSGIGVDQISVEIEGEKFPMREIATITRSGSNIIRLDFSAVPEATKAAYNAINESGMNVNPQMESTMIYLTIPKITRDHRERLAKNCKTLVTQMKARLSKLHSSYVRVINDKKQEPGISEELAFKTTDNLRYIFALAIEECDRLLEAKTKELLE